MSTPSTLRDAWRGFITPDDYDAHMDANGQAQAAAEIVGAFLRTRSGPGRRAWIAGAGTGRLFELLPADDAAGLRLTLTDINFRYLTVLRRRLGSARPASFVVDDLERSSVRGRHDLAVVVLVLEHVDQERALESLAAAQPRDVLTVIQRNPAGQDAALVPGQTPVGTVGVLQHARPQLVDRARLVARMEARGYRAAGEHAREVAFGKALVGLVFERR